MTRHKLHTLKLATGSSWISKWWINVVELCSRSDRSSLATTLHVGWISWIGWIGLGGFHQFKTIFGFVPYSYFSSYIFVLYMHLFMFFFQHSSCTPFGLICFNHRTSRQGPHCQHFRLQVFGFFGTPMAEALRKSQHGEHLNAMKVGSEKLWSGATWESPLNQFMPGGTGKVWPFTDSCRKMGANYAETQGGTILGMGGLIQVHLKIGGSTFQALGFAIRIFHKRWSVSVS